MKLLIENWRKFINERDDMRNMLPGQPGYEERERELGNLFNAVMEAIDATVTVREGTFGENAIDSNDYGRYYSPPSSIAPDVIKYLEKTFEFKHTDLEDVKRDLSEFINKRYPHGSGPTANVQYFDPPRSEHRYGTKVIGAGDREYGTLKSGDVGTGPDPYLGPRLPEEQKRWDQDGRPIR